MCSIQITSSKHTTYVYLDIIRCCVYLHTYAGWSLREVFGIRIHPDGIPIIPNDSMCMCVSVCVCINPQWFHTYLYIYRERYIYIYRFTYAYIYIHRYSYIYIYVVYPAYPQQISPVSPENAWPSPGPGQTHWSRPWPRGAVPCCPSYQAPRRSVSDGKADGKIGGIHLRYPKSKIRLWRRH